MGETKSNPYSLKARLRGIQKKYGDIVCLDLGCGKDESPISHAVLEIPWRVLVSVDAWEHNISALQDKRKAGGIAAVHWTYYIEPIEKIVPRLPDKKYDVTLFIDSLEHLPKPVALSMLAEAERLTTTRIIIFLPIGPCPQGPLNGNPFEVHQSTWTVDELESLGYDVQLFPQLHRHINPWVDAAWAVKKV